jgi:hypothetical protein
MAKATRVHSTPPTNTSAIQAQSSRRTFLAQAAGVAAGGAALGAGLPLPALAAAAVDPIFAVIDEHKKAHAGHWAAINELARMEKVDGATLAGGQHKHTDIKAERIERAIADDVEFLTAHPTRTKKSG